MNISHVTIARSAALMALAWALAGAATPGLAQKETAEDRRVGLAAAAGRPAVKAPAPRPDAVRTLEDITIEGEIAVPQVLFITSRDFRRFRDGLGLQFRMTTLDVARSVDLPTRLRFVAQNKEESE